MVGWGQQGPAGTRSITLTLAAVAGPQQRLLVLAVVCKGRRSCEIPPGLLSCC